MSDLTLSWQKLWVEEIDYGCSRAKGTAHRSQPGLQHCDTLTDFKLEDKLFCVTADNENSDHLLKGIQFRLNSMGIDEVTVSIVKFIRSLLRGLSKLFCQVRHSPIPKYFLTWSSSIIISANFKGSTIRWSWECLVWYKALMGCTLEIVDDSVNAVMLDDQSDNSHKPILLASEVRITFNFGSSKD